MDSEQFDKINKSLNRIAAATLAVAIINSTGRKAKLKEVQVAYNDCYMIVDPAVGSDEQEAFQERINKREW